MARAKRHYIPGHIWNITHRCHKREFLLKFSKDRRRWLQWLYEAKRRYALTILNYMVTSNHTHLSREARDFASSTCVDHGNRDVIPSSIKLVAVIMSLVGVVWFVGGQHGFVLGGLLFFVGIGLFTDCRIF